MVSMGEFAKTKQEARKAGYTEGNPVVYNPYMLNGQIVEVAFAHLLGIVQRHMTTRFNIIITKELDKAGADFVIELNDSVKFIDIKHTAGVGTREYMRGAFLVQVNTPGSLIIHNFLTFYKIKPPILDQGDYMAYKSELDYVWCKYTKAMYK